MAHSSNFPSQQGRLESMHGLHMSLPDWVQHSDRLQGKPGAAYHLHSCQRGLLQSHSAHCRSHDRHNVDDQLHRHNTAHVWRHCLLKAASCRPQCDQPAIYRCRSLLSGKKDSLTV